MNARKAQTMKLLVGGFVNLLAAIKAWRWGGGGWGKLIQHACILIASNRYVFVATDEQGSFGF